MPRVRLCPASCMRMPLNSDEDSMARRSLLLIAVLCLCMLVARMQAEAQEKGPVQFTGISHLTWQTASQQGPWQQLPPSFLRWDLNSVLNIYGLPISIQALATTEENEALQHINAFSIGLSRADLQDQIRRRIDERIAGLSSLQDRLAGLTPEAAAESVRAFGGTLPGGQDAEAVIAKLQELRDLKETDLQARMEELQSMGLASATQGIASLFPLAVLGVTYPSYTRLTIDGTALTGVQLEFTPGVFYLALAGGQIQSAAEASSSWMSVFDQAAYRRTLAAGRLGVGARDDTHLYLNVVYGSDDPGSLNRDSLHRPVMPEKNAVVGADGRVFLFDERLELGGEFAYSVRTADVQAPGPADADIPSWMNSIVDANLTSVGGTAISFDGRYRFAGSGTMLSADFRRVSSGYASPGVPYLRKDNMRFEGKAEQSFASRQMSVAAFYRRDEDDLSGSRGWGTTINAFGAQVSMNFRGLPYLRLSYAPLSQVSRVLADSLKIESDVLAVSGSSGYTFRTRAGLTSSTMLSVNYHEGRTQVAGGMYISRALMFVQSVGFAFPLTLQMMAGVMGTDVAQTTSSIVNSEFSATYATPGNWQTTAGVSLSRDAVQRTGVYLRSSLPVWQGGTVELFAERSIYEDTITSFNESLLRVVVTQVW
jgi:hypothetical protein